MIVIHVKDASVGNTPSLSEEEKHLTAILCHIYGHAFPYRDEIEKDDSFSIVLLCYVCFGSY